jgi:RHS repeat-associated protein
MFFDNLVVQHRSGPLLEETHYYPFGLTMAGISSKAFGKVENKKEKFQGQEFNDDLDVNYYEFKWRHHDPQIGRFIQIDPLANEYVYNSTYAFSENKVTNHIELEGLEAAPVPGGNGSLGDPRYYILEGFRQYFQAIGSLFQVKAEVHLNQEQQVKVQAGPVENSTTVTIVENKAEIKTNFGDYFKNYGKTPMIEVKAESNVVTKVENKTEVKGTVNGVPSSMSATTTVNESGTQKTLSAGPKVSVDVNKGKVDVSAQGFVTKQISGENVGQYTVGFKAAADATFVNKRIPVIDTKYLKISTTTQTKVGGSITIQTTH